MRTRRRHATGTVLACVLALLASVLAGCSLFPRPPASLVRQASHAAAEARALPGVAAATSDVSSRDWKDHPGDWIVSIVVRARAASGLTTVSAPVVDAVRGAGIEGAYDVSITLEVPGAPGLAPVSVSSLGDERPGTHPDSVEAADLLRRLGIAGRVSLSPANALVFLTGAAASGPAPLATAAAAIRGVEDFGRGELASVEAGWSDEARGRHRSVEVTAAAPSAALVGVLDGLWTRADVVSISEVENRGWSRPSLSIESGHPESDAQGLAAAADPAADRGERPRTAFDVHDPHFSTSVEGFVGLPLGSPKPGLTWPELLSPAPPGDSTAPSAPDAGRRLSGPAAAQQLSAYTDDVREFLQTTTAEAAPAVQAISCDTGAGRSVHGTVVLSPAHDPDAMFSAVTAAWTRAGLVRNGRALGTDYWAPDAERTGPAGIASASIRGTADGIRIGVSSPCVR